MNMPIKVIKRILKEELKAFYDMSHRAFVNIGCMSSAPNQMMSFAYHTFCCRIDDADGEFELDDVIGDLYAMSLEDWVNSIPEKP